MQPSEWKATSWLQGASQWDRSTEVFFWMLIAELLKLVQETQWRRGTLRTPRSSEESTRPFPVLSARPVDAQQTSKKKKKKVFTQNLDRVLPTLIIRSGVFPSPCNFPLSHGPDLEAQGLNHIEAKLSAVHL